MEAIIREDSTFDDPAVERRVPIGGVGTVVFGLSAQGITARVKGTKIKLRVNWMGVVEAMHTPGNVPSFLEGRPVEFLQHYLVKVEGKKKDKVKK